MDSCIWHTHGVQSEIRKNTIQIHIRINPVSTKFSEFMQECALYQDQNIVFGELRLHTVFIGGRNI